MRIRIRFSKKGDVRFLGHLDILRYFQRLFNRANVLMEYSEGFNPHQKLSFAQPLGVGILSSGEYLDAEIKEGQSLDDIKNRLSIAAGSGFEIISVKKVCDNADKAMAALKAASYRVCGSFGFSQSTVDMLLNKNEFFVPKKTKSGIREVDIRPMIISLDFKSGFLYMTLTAASDNNLKADTVMKALFDIAGMNYNKNDFLFERLDLFADNMISLEHYQTV